MVKPARLFVAGQMLGGVVVKRGIGERCMGRVMHGDHGGVFAEPFIDGRSISDIGMEQHRVFDLDR